MSIICIIMAERIRIKIKRFDKDLPLPSKKSAGAACLDMYARLSTTIEGQSFGYIPLNVAIQIPKGHWLLLAPRSSTHKHGLIPANGIGIGDHDFSGDDDEYQLAVFNTKANPVTIPRGERIAQMMVLQGNELEIEEVANLTNQNRGGFGSTGRK